MTTRTARVELPAAAERSYDIRIGPDTAREAAREIPDLIPNARRVVIAADSNLPTEFVQKVAKACAAVEIEPAVVHLTATEKAKTTQSAERVAIALAEHACTRSDALIALGGGVIGDVAGFAAAAYQRGINFIQCPTTLLSMVDASVGGKTGVNMTVSDSGGRAALLKNYFGAFHQPVRVAADTDALASLSERDFRAGLAECLKHAMIAEPFGDPDLGAWTDANAKSILNKDPEALAELIERNVRIKAAVVATDERELAASRDGGRALLNLGHTFGHAIETIPTLSPDGDPASAPLRHGEAIALGLIAATACSIRLGLIDTAILERNIAWIAGVGLPTAVAGLPTDGELIARMAKDKKARAGKIRVVLPVGEATCRVIDAPDTAALAAGWSAIRADR